MSNRRQGITGGHQTRDSIIDIHTPPIFNIVDLEENYVVVLQTFAGSRIRITSSATSFSGANSPLVDAVIQKIGFFVCLYSNIITSASSRDWKAVKISLSSRGCVTKRAGGRTL